MKITQIVAREVFDSQGFPALECELFLENNHSVRASVSGGYQRGLYEALELKDGGNRFMGRGFKKACDYIENAIAPMLLGKQPDVFSMDLAMIELDGTNNKAKLGANTMLVVSKVIVKAQAMVQGLELYEMLAHLYGAPTVTLPYPILTMMSTITNAKTSFKIKDLMVVPFAAESFRHAMELGVTLFHELIRFCQSIRIL